MKDVHCQLDDLHRKRTFEHIIDTVNAELDKVFDTINAKLDKILDTITPVTIPATPIYDAWYTEVDILCRDGIVPIACLMEYPTYIGLKREMLAAAGDIFAVEISFEGYHTSYRGMRIAGSKSTIQVFPVNRPLKERFHFQTNLELKDLQ